MSFLLADCPLSLYYSWHPFCLHLLVVVVVEMHYTKFLKKERRCATVVKQQSLCPALHPRACLFFQTTLASSQRNKGGPHYRGCCSGCDLATAISLPLHWPCGGDHAGCCCPFFENWDFSLCAKDMDMEHQVCSIKELEYTHIPIREVLCKGKLSPSPCEAHVSLIVSKPHHWPLISRCIN